MESYILRYFGDTSPCPLSLLVTSNLLQPLATDFTSPQRPPQSRGFAGRRAQCEMTGGNWGRIHEADSDLTSLLADSRAVVWKPWFSPNKLLIPTGFKQEKC